MYDCTFLGDCISARCCAEDRARALHCCQLWQFPDGATVCEIEFLNKENSLSVQTVLKTFSRCSRALHPGQWWSARISTTSLYERWEELPRCMTEVEAVNRRCGNNTAHWNADDLSHWRSQAYKEPYLGKMIYILRLEVTSCAIPVHLYVLYCLSYRYRLVTFNF